MNSATSGNTPPNVNLYDVSIFIIGTAPPALALGTVAVAEVPLSQTGFMGLIGRDILERCAFHYNGPLKGITISF